MIFMSIKENKVFNSGRRKKVNLNRDMKKINIIMIKVIIRRITITLITQGIAISIANSLMNQVIKINRMKNFKRLNLELMTIQILLTFRNYRLSN